MRQRQENPAAIQNYFVWEELGGKRGRSDEQLRGEGQFHLVDRRHVGGPACAGRSAANRGDGMTRNRRSIRLKEYDYAQAGAYFVTTCTRNRECLLGEIVEGQMVLNDAGQLVREVWNGLMDHIAMWL